MQPSLAQVLNTLSHEIRTPLAVSQGYLKLYVDGRLTEPDDQQRALQKTREALGAIAALCTDMGKVSALLDTPAPALPERLDLNMFLTELRSQIGGADASWTGAESGQARLATNNPRDLVRAVSIVTKSAFDDARDAPRGIHAVVEPQTLTLLAGNTASAADLGEGPDRAGAGAVNIARGGKGLSLIWASVILRQHRVKTWTHQQHRASVGFRFPLEQV